MADLGRQVKYGFGKETVAGTAVAATYWVPQLSADMHPVVDPVINNAGFGVLEKTNDSVIAHQWAEGSLEAKLDTASSGLLLLSAFGSVSSANNADPSNSVKDHTFTINQAVNGQTLTLVRKDSVDVLAYALCRIGKWELHMKLDDYITFSADLISKIGATTTATPAYTTPTEFVAKHFNVKTAANLAGLSGATNMTALETFTLTVDPNIETDFQSGSADPYSISSRGYDLEFEFESRYNDTTYRDAWKNGTALALQVTAKNTDVTIGTAANPGLVLTAPKMHVTDWSPNEDLDKPNTQKVKGTIHYDATNAYALRAVFTNLVTSY